MSSPTARRRIRDGPTGRESRSDGPSADPLSAPLWPGLRRLVLFVLGVVVIIDSLASAGQNLGQLLVGSLLIGIVPVDELLSRIAKRRSGGP